MAPYDHNSNRVARGGAGALPADAPDTGSRLLRLAEFARALGAERLAGDARALAERLAEGRFYVACIGQFKRGKSSLIGALVGDAILPTGVVPITTVPTVIRYGPARRARVRFRSGAWTEIEPGGLAEYVSEEKNPENEKGVEGVEVFVPSALLAAGMCLVDTPGLGSVFGGGTRATHAFVPHIDAAIIVVGADPPLAGEELALVESIGMQVRDLLVVLNKADRTTPAERETARNFTRKVLEARLGRTIGAIHEISALERLEARGPARDWPEFLRALESLVVQSGTDLVRAAGERGLRRLSEELLLVIAEERDALLSPLEEYERRIATLRAALDGAQRSLQDLGFLFLAEQHRLSDAMLARRKEFLGAALPKARADFAEPAARLRRKHGPAYRRDAMHMAQVIAEKHVLPWLRAEQARAEEEYRNAAGRFVDLANEFLARLAYSGVPELTRLPHALESEKGFRYPSRFTFEGLLHVAQPASPLRYIADTFLGLFGASSVIQKQASEFLHYLLEMNGARVQSDVVERAQESRSRLEIEVRKLLHEVALIAGRALEHARAAKSAGAAAVEARIAWLLEIETEIHSIVV